MILFLKILDVILKCGTEYSRFKSVDLQKWSLKLPAGKYKIKGKVNLLSNAAKGSKSGIDHKSKIPPTVSEFPRVLKAGVWDFGEQEDFFICLCLYGN